jgi:hypothetical protein
MTTRRRKKKEKVPQKKSWAEKSCPLASWPDHLSDGAILPKKELYHLSLKAAKEIHSGAGMTRLRD